MPILEPLAIAAIAAVTFLAAFVQGVTGFGSALLAMPLLALFIDVKTASPLVALLSLAINLVLLLPARHRLPWRRITPLLAGSLAGIPGGVLFLAGADERWVRSGLGAALIISSLCLLRFGAVPFGAGKGAAFSAGVFSGLLGGAFNTSGPPVLLYTASQAWDKGETHAVLQLYFFASGLAIVSLHALSGLTTPAVLLVAAAALPFLVAGSFIGYALHRRVGEERFRTLVQVTLLAAGITLLVARGSR